MPKQAISILFFLPLIASAKCEFTQSGDTMTIVVSKGADKCFSSETFKEAFKTSLAQAAETREPRELRRKKAIDHRSASGEKLWALEERVYQASMPTGRYFGQKN